MSAKKIFQVVLWCSAIVSLGTVIFFLVVMSKVSENMIDNAYAHSNGIPESKQYKLFLGYYTPLQDSLSLNGLQVKTETLWYEKQWRWDHSSSSDPQRKIFPGINLIAPYTFPEQSDRDIAITTLCNGVEDKLALTDYGDIGYVAECASSPDTIALIVYSTTGFRSNNLQTFKDTVWYSKK